MKLREEMGKCLNERPDEGKFVISNIEKEIYTVAKTLKPLFEKYFELEEEWVDTWTEDDHKQYGKLWESHKKIMKEVLFDLKNGWL